MEALQLPADSAVVRRARIIRNKDDGPVELSTSWFAAELAEQAPQLLVGERLRGGTAKYFSSITNRAPTYVRDQVTVRLATAEERRLILLSRPSAVLAYRLTIFDDQDVPMQFDEATYPPGRWAFRQEYPLNP